MHAIIGVDIGTTSTKTALFDQNGHLLTKTMETYPLYQTLPGYAEEDPDEILAVVMRGIAQMMAFAKAKSYPVSGVSFSAAMHSLILMDSQNRPLTRVITWADNRAIKQSEALQKNGIAQILYKKTGTPNHPMTPLTKIIWFREERPNLFAQAQKFIGIKTYVFYKLFGQYVADYGLASATGLFNLKTMTWDDQALKIAGISQAQLPRLVATETIFSGVTAKVAQKMQVSGKLPFIVGSSDGALANLGAGATKTDQLAVSIGTSGAVRMVVDHPVLDPKGNLFCYVLGKDRWIIGGPVNNGGIILQWVQEQWLKKQPRLTYPELMNLASQSVPGAHGLMFLPYLGGERAPIWNADARGSFLGLTRQHTQADLVRAVLEGIILNLCVVKQMIEKLTGPIHGVKATGGFAQASLWVQILADCFDQSIEVVDGSTGTALGAATMGFDSLKIHFLQDRTSGSQVWHPNLTNVKRYQDLMPIWQQCSQLLIPEYQKMAAFQHKYNC
ncbi:gluconokinase [Pediococcus cellicola]|uniref:Gluconokinase n=1 Tax=Pediococcus cellicola TaxID=319652 RepID=A0A0R2IK43_9LACO|nr:gluconokinase [Pediococcus cellicola]KRN64974.1 gluconokinase [Pediococcus cellicola]GEL16017.1 gluconate kinase [Pediococcus cellicola]